MKNTQFLLFAFLIIFCSIDAYQTNTVYAYSTSYASNNSSYVHIGSYEDFRIFTDVSIENFGDQTIESYDGALLYDNEGRCEYVFYPYFFILVNYYHAFEVVTVSPWGFDGIDAMTNVNKQYVEYYQ